MKQKRIVIIGSTGSIGEQALQVIAAHPEQFRVMGLAAGSNIHRLIEQAHRFQPEVLCVGRSEFYPSLREQVEGAYQVLAGMEGLCELATLEQADIVLVSVSGAVGIQPTLAAIGAQKRVALANKETLVAAGDLVMKAVQENDTELIPVDSEHAAIFQCIRDEQAWVRNLWLTASGGPFRDYKAEQMKNITVEEALNHPNWEMGAKITVDSATLMNKGLEVIEAHHLFSAAYDCIKIIIQRESVIHSMVEFVDGSFLAHLGVADMRIPIQYAFSYPERMVSPARQLDFTALGSIHFESPDYERFPSLLLAVQAGRTGGTMPAVMNAANETAVAAFLQRKLSFMQIPELIAAVMSRHQTIQLPTLEQIMEADQWARDESSRMIY
ncbi:MAG TPA: 1-deoxy-D-xylulose-5-phosphate reductoisomerase [Syntrophomonadaceae bacterium]|nr:1-deoxy-D-xylulose-5-phosphate reductoisomerase [Syntrophomonadaceae bacterium]